MLLWDNPSILYGCYLGINSGQVYSDVLIDAGYLCTKYMFKDLELLDGKGALYFCNGDYIIAERQPIQVYRQIINERCDGV